MTNEFTGRLVHIGQTEHFETREGKKFTSREITLVTDEQFSKSDLMALRARNGQSTNVAMVISRWKAAGFIRQVEKNTYRKTPKAHVS